MRRGLALIALLFWTPMSLAGTQPSADAVFMLAKERCIDPITAGAAPVLSDLKSRHRFPGPNALVEGRWFDTVPQLISPDFNHETALIGDLRRCFAWISGDEGVLRVSLEYVMFKYASGREVATEGLVTIPACPGSGGMESLLVKGNQQVRGTDHLRVVASHFGEQKRLSIMAFETPENIGVACG
ncbi:MAG: hypothetical protein AAF526_11555 [Pseudomonadota bacterium]